MYGNSIFRREDLTVANVTTPFVFNRTFTNNIYAWNTTPTGSGYKFDLAGVPKPFGSGSTPNTALWWHNLYGFVTLNSNNHWIVIDANGHADVFIPCILSMSSLNCTADHVAEDGSAKGTLRAFRVSGSTDLDYYIYYATSGLQYRYGHLEKYLPNTSSRYPYWFLESVSDAKGVVLYYVNYGIWPGVTGPVECPRGLFPDGGGGLPDGGVPVDGPGVRYPDAGGIFGFSPYIYSVPLASGGLLSMKYEMLPTFGDPECVPSELDLADATTSQVYPVERFKYTMLSYPDAGVFVLADGGTSETGGLLALVQPADAGGLIYAPGEVYSYTPGPMGPSQFTASVDGFVSINTQYDATGAATNLTEPNSGLGVSYTVSPVIQNSSVPIEGVTCAAVSGFDNYGVATYTANAGDDSTGTVTVTQSLLSLSMSQPIGGNPGGLHQQVPNFRSMSCTGGIACSPGKDVSDWVCGASIAPQEGWVGNRAGEWEFKEFDAGWWDGGLYLSNTPEMTRDSRGGASQGTTTFLAATSYTYSYDSTGNQHVATESEPSGFSGQKKTYYRYAPSGRLSGVIRSGYTSTPGVFLSFSYIGTFYFDNYACLGTTPPDPYGRTLEVHGPCVVANENATDCSGTDVPITQYHYWGTGGATPANAANMLKSVERYVKGNPTSCTGTILKTTYDAYDRFGNPTSVTDFNNSITTTYTYDKQLMTSRTINSAMTTYSYRNGKLVLVTYPLTPESGLQTSYDVYCYQDGTSSGCSGNWTGSLMWKAHSPTADGSSSWEKVKYSYWPDGTLKTESYWTNGGLDERRQITHAADAEKRPSFTRWGTGTGSYTAPRLFDGANNEIGVGLPFNGATTLCGGPTVGGVVDPKCDALSYDLLNRLSTAVYPSPFNTSESCFSWNSSNTAVTVKQGCSTSTSCSSCTGPTMSYQYDDFGNIVSVLPYWTDVGGSPAAIKYGYNALGKMTDKQEPSTTLPDGGGTPTMQYTYDSLGRELTASAFCASGTGCSSSVQFTNTYDAPPTSPPTGCPLASAALSYGRLYSQTDSFGTTYYKYDPYGNVTDELRDRTGTGCSITLANPNQNPNTRYTYDSHSNLTSITYPYGRTVAYVYDGGYGPDRPASIYVSTNNGTWTTPGSKLIDKIAWEPYGGLRGYEIEHTNGGLKSGVEYALGDDASSALSKSCPETFPSAASSDYTGRVRALVVSAGAFSPGSVGTGGNIYTKKYKWTADQLTEARACVLSGTGAQYEAYDYDSLLHLTFAGGSLGGTAGNSYSRRDYVVDTSGQRSSVKDDSAVTYNYSYDSHKWLSSVKPLPDAGWYYGYTNFNDGSVRTKFTATDSSGGPGTVYDFINGPTAADAGAAPETVFRAVGINGAYYNYFYNANGHRRYKSYPSGIGDEYFYDGSGNLLVDQGNSAFSSPTYYTQDNYVWLGGKPVVLFRGITNTSWAEQSDTSTACGRLGDTNTCGAYFPVTDQVNKTLVMLDSTQRITGLGEYDPFGQINRVSVDSETTHPYPTNSAGTSINLEYPPGTATVINAGTLASLTVDYRAKFQSTDMRNTTSTYCTKAGYPTRDSLHLVDDTSGSVISNTVTGKHGGVNWSSWVTPPSGKARATMTYGAYGQFFGTTCTITGGPPYNIFGIVMEGYEYRRYDGSHGASPFWTPLRFAGQYHDEETDLNENHHRYYEPLTGRYLEPEPLLVNSPEYLAHNTRSGLTTSVFEYARGNPINVVDQSGNRPYDTKDGDDQIYAEVCNEPGDGPPDANGVPEVQVIIPRIQGGDRCFAAAKQKSEVCGGRSSWKSCPCAKRLQDRLCINVSCRASPPGPG
jgi:RHS repeat-associated protein